MDEVNYSFFDSSLFNSIITLVVGSVALLIYYFRRIDEKRKAAKLVLLEIQSAEENLRRLSSNLKEGKLPHDIRIVPVNSWTENSYRFVNKLDKDEWDAITDFYDKGTLIDSMINHQASFFWHDVEEIRANKQRVAAEYAKNLLDTTLEDIKNPDTESAIPTQEQLIDDVSKIYDAFNVLYEKTIVTYSPERVVLEAKKYLADINLQLSISTAGSKLKKLTRTFNPN